MLVVNNHSDLPMFSHILTLFLLPDLISGLYSTSQVLTDLSLVLLVLFQLKETVFPHLNQEFACHSLESAAILHPFPILSSKLHC